MGLLSDFFISEKTPTPQYEYEPNTSSPDCCHLKYITPLEAAGILSVLRGGGDPLELMDKFPRLTLEDADEWIMSVPEEMTSALLAIEDEQIPGLAQQCVTATTETLDYTQDDFQEVLRQLRDLARRAQQTNRVIYLWISL